jgi:succinate dehydrogenase hydrophobic anchor subunit
VKLSEARKAAKAAAPTAHKFAKHVVPQVVKPARIFWNQIIGFIFLVLSLMGIRPIIQNYNSLSSDSSSPVRLAFSVLFTVTMLIFGITSFMRARRLSRL